LVNEKSYSGDLMQKGMANEVVVLNWLNSIYKDTIDFREFKLAQRIDVDFGVESAEGDILLAEVKSDRYIRESGNLCFENHRINHFVKERWFYLGWGWRSPAQKLIVRNPETSETFVFDFQELRAEVGKFVSSVGKELRVSIVPTDRQKTTFNYLIPMKNLRCFKKFIVK